MAGTVANLALDGGDPRFHENTGEGIINYSEREIKHLHDPNVKLEEYICSSMLIAIEPPLIKI